MLQIWLSDIFMGVIETLRRFWQQLTGKRAPVPVRVPVKGSGSKGGRVRAGRTYLRVLADERVRTGRKDWDERG